MQIEFKPFALQIVKLSEFECNVHEFQNNLFALMDSSAGPHKDEHVIKNTVTNRL